MIVRTYETDYSTLQARRYKDHIELMILNESRGGSESHDLSIEDCEDLIFQLEKMIRILKDEKEEKNG